jgi:hypothetical protein
MPAELFYTPPETQKNMLNYGNGNMMWKAQIHGIN